MSKSDDAKRLAQQALDKALTAQQSSARENVERLRRVHPDDTPQELIRRLDRDYLTGFIASEAVSVAAGIASGTRTPTALIDVIPFTQASARYLLSLAEVHGTHPEDFEQRRRLLSRVLLGGGAVLTWGKVVEHAGPHWARRIVSATPMSVIDMANKAVRPRFITKYGTKQGVLVLSELTPLAVGLALGGCGNLVFRRLMIKSAHTVFGPPPSSWDGDDRRDKEPLDSGSGDAAP